MGILCLYGKGISAAVFRSQASIFLYRPVSPSFRLPFRNITQISSRRRRYQFSFPSTQLCQSGLTSSVDVLYKVYILMEDVANLCEAVKSSMQLYSGILDVLESLLHGYGHLLHRESTSQNSQPELRNSTVSSEKLWTGTQLRNITV